MRVPLLMAESKEPATMDSNLTLDERYNIVVFYEQSCHKVQRGPFDDESKHHGQRIRYVQRKFEEKFHRPAPCRNVIDKTLIRFHGTDDGISSDKNAGTCVEQAVHDSGQRI